jgi:hypothetical protein
MTGPEIISRDMDGCVCVNAGGRYLIVHPGDTYNFMGRSWLLRKDTGVFENVTPPKTGIPVGDGGCLVCHFEAWQHPVRLRLGNIAWMHNEMVLPTGTLEGDKRAISDEVAKIMEGYAA